MQPQDRHRTFSGAGLIFALDGQSATVCVPLVPDKVVLPPQIDASDITIAVALAASAFGRLGGSAGTGASKRRSRAHYQRIGRLGGISPKRKAVLT